MAVDPELFGAAGATLDRLYTAWADNDLARLRDCLCEDVECRSMWGAEPIIYGRENVAADLLTRRQLFHSGSTTEILLGVECATALVNFDYVRMAVTFLFDAKYQVRTIAACSEAGLDYRQRIF